jgi:hypothetical protein
MTPLISQEDVDGFGFRVDYGQNVFVNDFVGAWDI